jgi:hypothetical protein
MTEIERTHAALDHLLVPLLSHAADYSVNVIEGKSVVIVEVSVHTEDFAYLNGDQDTEGTESLFQSLQRLISVTSKERKMSLDLLEVAA